MMSLTDENKGMLTNEERELRRVFDFLANFRPKCKLNAAIVSTENRQETLKGELLRLDPSSGNEYESKKEEIEKELKELASAIEKYTMELAIVHGYTGPMKCIRKNDLYDAIKSLGKKCSKKEIHDMIWEADENLDGCVDWDELRGMFNRNLMDKTNLEPVNLFNVVQFMTYDKKNCGVITADDTMAILFARYGQSQLEMRMRELFGDSDELTFVRYLERIGKQRRVKAESK